MSKKQGDVIVYQRNGVAIQALVAFSRQVLLPEGPTEHLTVVYLDPAAASAAPTGEQLRNSIKTQADVPPLVENAVNGWKEVNVAAFLPEGWIAGDPRYINAPKILTVPPPDGTEPTVTGEGKTQAELDVELEAQKAERTPEEKALEPTN